MAARLTGTTTAVVAHDATIIGATQQRNPRFKLRNGPAADG